VSALFQSRLQERLDECERIARELRDTLPQGTQALVLDVEAASQLKLAEHLHHDPLTLR
jgi:hypothetical protein